MPKDPEVRKETGDSLETVAYQVCMDSAGIRASKGHLEYQGLEDLRERREEMDLKARQETQVCKDHRDQQGM